MHKKLLIITSIIVIILLLFIIFFILFNKTNSELPILNYTNIDTENTLQTTNSSYSQNEEDVNNAVYNIISQVSKEENQHNSNTSNLNTNSQDVVKIPPSSTTKKNSKEAATTTDKKQTSSTSNQNNIVEDTNSNQSKKPVNKENTTKYNDEKIDMAYPSQKEEKDSVNEKLANTHFTKYNSSKTNHAVQYINNKMREDEYFEKLGGEAIAVSKKPTDFWFSYNSDYKLDNLCIAGIQVQVYVEDEYVYDTKGINYYLYDTKAYIYQSVI